MRGKLVNELKLPVSLPNQVLTHAARAAASRRRHLWWPRAARAKGSGQRNARSMRSRICLSNLLSACLLPSHSIEDAARDGPCAHGKHFCFQAPEFRRNSKRASPVKLSGDDLELGFCVMVNLE